MKRLDDPEAREDILHRLRKVEPDSRRHWGKMTAPQMICHLHDAFKVYAGDKPVGLQGSAVQRLVLKWVAIKLPLPWPKGFKTMPEIDQELAGAKPSDFKKDKKELRDSIERFSRSAGSDRPEHPIFGRLTEQEWMRLGYLHADHHLRQFGA